MGISGLNDYNSLIQNYHVPTIPDIRLEDIQSRNGREEILSEASAANIHEEASTVIPARQDVALEDISITFNKQEGFDYIGQDKDIRALDMEKAISDMKKYQILQQYQYFVGSARNLMEGSADGLVIAKF